MKENNLLKFEGKEIKELKRELKEEIKKIGRYLEEISKIAEEATNIDEMYFFLRESIRVSKILDNLIEIHNL